MSKATAHPEQERVSSLRRGKAFQTAAPGGVSGTGQIMKTSACFALRFGMGGLTIACRTIPLCGGSSSVEPRVETSDAGSTPALRVERKI
jgi:hypothetical protein